MSSRRNSAVLIGSPDGRVRTRWRQELQGMFAIYYAARRRDLERRIVKLKPSVLLIDLSLPQLHGIRGLQAIKHLSPLTKFIVLTAIPDESEQLLALKAGAGGYCSTDMDRLLIRKAVQMVQKGEIWVERSVIVRLIKELVSRTPSQEKASLPDPIHLKKLTPRQNEIACLIGRAASNKEIASLLNITEATVKAHLTAIFRKLGISDRLRLALYVKANT